MRYIFTTLIFIMVLCIITLMIISLILKINPYLIKTRISLILICLGLISIRMFLPFDFPFVHPIEIHNILPDIFLFLYNPLITIRHYDLSLFDLFNVLWAVGSAIFIIRACFRYILTGRAIHNLSRPAHKRIYQIIDRILESYKRPISFSVVLMDEITSPMVFGIFKPYIVLPQGIVNDDELYYILSHEIAHYYHGDLLIKLTLEAMQAIYWWNPLFYFIRVEINKLLEINTDIEVTKLFDERKTISYLQCLLKAAKFREKQKDSRFISAFNGYSTTSIAKRVHIILDNFHTGKRHNFVNHLTVTFLLILTLVMPNLFTIVSVAEKPEFIQESYFEINPKNSFCIQMENGTFDLYVEYAFIINLSSIDFIDEPIPVYSSLKEALHK